MKLEKYKNWLFANTGSYHTVSNYIYRIQKLFEKFKTIENITEEGIIEFFKELKEKYSPSTVNGYKYAIQSYFQFKKINIPLPKHERFNLKEPDSITQQFFENDVIPVVEYIFKEPLKIKTILYIMFYSGLRREEIPKLKWKDIDFEKRRIHLYGKGKKHRETLMSKKTVSYLKIYKDSYPIQDKIFDINIGGVNYIFKRINPYLKNVNFRPVLMRHSFATHLLRQVKMSLADVSKLLGHARIETTMRYVDTNIDEIQKEYDKKVK